MINMTITGVVIAFALEPEDSLKPLLARGYSTPVKTGRGTSTTKTAHTHASSVEVERIDNRAYATITVYNEVTAAKAVDEVLKDFVNAGLLL